MQTRRRARETSKDANMIVDEQMPSFVTGSLVFLVVLIVCKVLTAAHAGVRSSHLSVVTVTNSEA